jgi:meso-butanediol dehydrogenase / (S,S)-butanediol dehydrogenase / diacetyl reductase
VASGRLEGKVALITGTAQGMGRAAAVRFAREGAKIVGCDINVEGDRETVRRVRRNGGEMVSLEPLDLCEPGAAERLVDVARQTYGRLDVLYNNAAAPRFAWLTEMSREDWEFTIDNELNLIFYMVRAAVRLLIESGGGSIINVSSIAGLAGQPIGVFAHAAAQGGVLAASRAMARELACHGIRSNTVVPGMIMNPDKKGGFDEALDAKEEVPPRILLGRVGTPEDVVSAALFFASDESSYVTGASLVVDGGWTAW